MKNKNNNDFKSSQNDKDLRNTKTAKNDQKDNGLENAHGSYEDFRVE